ncbi:DUF1906 domain-containing protein [Streptomyces sp. NPDC058691]|uniref:DUF1906 domain-containing protein n=1 Tax=Streptomyces sp. NPDC058691 TaxID=3346601 RepID=UPI003657623C
MHEHKPIIRYAAIVGLVLACLLTGPVSAEAAVPRLAATRSAVLAPVPASAMAPGGDTDPGDALSGYDLGPDLSGLLMPYDAYGSEEPDGATPERRNFKGYGFDTCRAPSLATMRAWLKSKYRAIGVYFGGRARACSQRNLNRNWVQSVHRMGWRIMPIYVGSQSPCVRGKHLRNYRIDPDDPEGQGESEGWDAVRSAADLGFEPGSALYLDMEAYRVGKARCADQTLGFIQAWDRQVSENGYLPGLYSSSESGIRHIERARRQGADDLPEAVWFARWKGRPAVRSEPVLSRDAWNGGRIHQYSGAVRERHGGKRLAIDRNRLDGPVAVVN